MLKRIILESYNKLKIILCTHCRQGDAVAVALSLSHSVVVIFDQVNVKVDRAVEHRHQVREFRNALDKRGKLYVELKIYTMLLTMILYLCSIALALALQHANMKI